uniref:Sulfide:quinone oxidoreductase, mitochondrial n=1 Tax=Panstrongylus megistus TaxID=65343 RepID=A0A069DU02_9HEMI
MNNLRSSLYFTVVRFASASSNKQSCKLLVLGGGTGGCTIAAKFRPKLGKNKIVVVEPNDKHYYQPMFTLVGGGIKPMEETNRLESSVLPEGVIWIKDTVANIDPESSVVMTKLGTEISYDYLVVALGIELQYNKIKGLEEALSIPDSGVCSNYSPKYVQRTYDTLSKIREGNAVFTFPNTPVKCAGAPLKACLISEDFIRKTGKRDKIRFYYRTSLPVIFSVKHYATKLHEVCSKRNVDVALKQELVEVDYLNREAFFKDVERPLDIRAIPYTMLHVTPPMGPPAVMQSHPDLVDHSGFLRVNKSTLKHDYFPNIYGIGDCTNLPTSKTAAAVAAQSNVLYKNLSSDIKGSNAVKYKYDGYTSCPLVTGVGTCIMAEFDYNLQPLETFPIDQSKEHFSMYWMKKNLMPFLYWNFMLRGFWSGPKLVRKMLHLGLSP